MEGFIGETGREKDSPIEAAFSRLKKVGEEGEILTAFQFKLAALLFPEEQDPSNLLLRWAGQPPLNLNEDNVHVPAENESDLIDPVKNYSRLFREFLDTNPEVKDRVLMGEESALQEVLEYLRATREVTH